MFSVKAVEDCSIEVPLVLLFPTRIGHAMETLLLAMSFRILQASLIARLEIKHLRCMWNSFA